MNRPDIKPRQLARVRATGLPDDDVYRRVLIEALNEALSERERYRRALVAIADQESGVWGRVAYRALHPDQPGGHAT